VVVIVTLVIYALETTVSFMCRAWLGTRASSSSVACQQRYLNHIC